jgi:hypothetical protein
MEIGEVEALLNSLRLLGLMAPQHVFITEEPIHASMDGEAYFRGLAVPRGDAVVLSKHADVTTVPHELVHSALGAGELAADTLGKLLALRYELAGNAPVLSALKFRQVRYQLQDDVPPEFKGRVKHYVRV